jgi:demethylmenaquinone methyltransferase/2-methoxy-6-polyprenyl-1,4-benzoquinol methylase
VAPLIGGFISRKKEEYVYLPRSLLDFPSSRRLKEMLEEEGMKQIEVYHLTLGVVAVHIGTKGGSL